ncbi:N-acetylglucosamine kinase [Fusibacter sp. JL298sf-3]
MYYVGIEGGLHKSVAYLSQDISKVMHSIEVGPMNYHVYGVEATQREIEKALQVLMLEADIELEAVGGICFGGGGVHAGADRVMFKEIFRRLGFTGHLYVCNDAVVRLASSGALKNRAILLAGTGSILYGYDVDGQCHTVGGWGIAIGDPGSGYEIAKKGIVAAINAAEMRGPETVLKAWFYNRVNARSIEELVNYFTNYTLGRTMISALTPLVFRAAREGDAVAKHIVDEAEGELLKSIQALARKMNSTSFELVLNGSIFVNNDAFVSALQESVRRWNPDVKVSFQMLNGALGALKLARPKDVK